MNQSLMENPNGLQAYRRRASASLRQKSAFLLGDRIWIITQQSELSTMEMAAALMHYPLYLYLYKP
jgi:hypothetical protein